MSKPLGSIFGLAEQSVALEDLTKSYAWFHHRRSQIGQTELIIGSNYFSMLFKWHWGGVTSPPQAGVAMGNERNVPLFQQKKSLFYQLGSVKVKEDHTCITLRSTKTLFESISTASASCWSHLQDRNSPQIHRTEYCRNSAPARGKRDCC